MKLFIYLSPNKERRVEGDPDKGMMKVLRRDRIVFYEERHALVYGSQMKEYLGMTETEDASILEKSAEEIRALNLPKIIPRDFRRMVQTNQGVVPLGSYRNML